MQRPVEMIIKDLEDEIWWLGRRVDQMAGSKAVKSDATTAIEILAELREALNVLHGYK